jgi:hypothetical protein
MRFGVALDLWSKEELEQATTKGVKKKAAPAPAEQGQTRKMSRPQPAGVSPAERKMFALLGETGRKDKAAALNYLTGVLGREITSRGDLSPEELSRVIKSLEAETEPTS